MIQAHYIYPTLFFYYYIVMYNEIIIQLPHYTLGLARGLTQTVTETSAQYGKEARSEVVNNIMGRPLRGLK